MKPQWTWSVLVLALAFGASMHGEVVQFAIIGDYGVDNGNELAVANLVKTNFQPSFVVTVGDNNYLGASEIDRAIGKYYHEFIGNYAGSYGAGASSNRFFPALGNHDWESATGYSAYLNYFTLPGNERYYEFVRGPVHFFVLNSDNPEPDGTTATSAQALWLSNRLRAATSPWRIVIAQDPPYSSIMPASRMRWPFQPWGASLVVSGHAHHYERISRDTFPYIVNGAGGASLVGFGNVTTGSVVRYSEAHGAMKVVATETNITYEFWSVAGGGTVIDRFVQTRPILSVARSNNTLTLSWPTNDTTGVVLQSSPSLAKPWTNVMLPPSMSGDRYVLTVGASPAHAFFRLSR
jgi:tartrate-resistant acid phosphatase type 5